MKDELHGADIRHTAPNILASNLVFIELKPEVAERLELPTHIPVLKDDIENELSSGQLPPATIAAGIEALKLLKPDLKDYDRFLARYFLLEGHRALESNPPDTFQAQKYFQEALDLEVGELSAEAAFYIAGLLQAADGIEAERYYRRSIELNPLSAATFYELALLLRERRDLPGALDEFQKAFLLEPDNVTLLTEVAETHLMADNTDQAKAAFLRAMELEPEFWVLPVRLGITEYGLQEYAAAIRHLRSGLDLSPDELETDSAQSLYVEGLYTLGLAYREIGDKGRAAKLFKAVQKLTPGNEAVTQSLQELS